MVGVAVTSVQSYGWDTMGMSDTMLEQARQAIAYAGSPEGGGKNVDLILALLDGASGTADPAFAAHIPPMRHLAFAVWEAWDDERAIEDMSMPGWLAGGEGYGTQSMGRYPHLSPRCGGWDGTSTALR